MADPFVAEIRIFAGSFAPKYWAFCNGQLLPISQNTALFSLLGTAYGGDGRSTFGLPNLQGRTPIHHGHGPGLSARTRGESGGSTTNTLQIQEIPAHAHVLNATGAAATTLTPEGKLLASGRPTMPALYGTSGTPVIMASSIGSTGGGEPHNNLQPYLTLNFIIALQGIFPPRS